MVVAAKPAAAEKAAARPPVAKPAAPSPTIAATIVAVAETPPPIPQPEVAATPEPEPAQPVPKEAEATPAQAVPETQPVEPAAATRAEPEPAPAASTALALSSVAAPIPAAPPAVASPLVLTAYVAPEFPERIKRRMRVDGEVVLGFTVKPDGSVADVTVRSSTEKSLEPNAIDAVRQWRYKPIDEAQLHAVQLVFRVKE